jgi:hypothetical protein
MPKISESDLDRVFAAPTSQVQEHFPITRAAQTLRAAGFPLGNDQYWQPLWGQVNQQFAGLSFEGKDRAIRILGQQLTTDGNAHTRETVEQLLRSHGFQFVDGAFVPIEFFDPREKRFMPVSSLSDASRALGRLVGGDLDGALAAVCGSVDAAASRIYSQHSLGDPGKVSFQQRAMTAIDAAGSLEALKTQLVELGWTEDEAKLLCHNLKGSLNQAAYVMQSLRSKMSDVHGSKPVLEAAVFDALKLASVLVSLMKETSCQSSAEVAPPSWLQGSH